MDERGSIPTGTTKDRKLIYYCEAHYRRCGEVLCVGLHVKQSLVAARPVHTLILGAPVQFRPAKYRLLWRACAALPCSRPFFGTENGITRSVFSARRSLCTWISESTLFRYLGLMPGAEKPVFRFISSSRFRSRMISGEEDARLVQPYPRRN